LIGLNVMIDLLLTGGTGFVGRAFLRNLLKDYLESGCIWAKITVMSRSPEIFEKKYPEFCGHSWLRFYKGDVMQKSSFPSDSTFTHIIHAATDSASRNKYTNTERHDQIIFGTRNALNYSVEKGIKRFVYISSGAIYGKNYQFNKLNENLLMSANPLQAENAYCIAKNEAEHLCALYGDAHGIEYVVARCFSFIGPDLFHSPNFAIVNFISDALKKNEIIVKSNGLARRTYLYQDDLAYWLKVICLYGRTGHAYNVGSNKVVSISELAYLVRDIVFPDGVVKILGSQKKDVKIDKYVPDIGKSMSELGLSVKISLDESIKRTAIIMESGFS